MLERLAETKDAWVREELDRRKDYLRAAIRGVLDVAETWVEEACRQRGIDPESQLSGEEWISGPMTVVRNLGLFVQALRQGGQPTPPGRREGPDGQTIVRVFPNGMLERVLYSDMSAEIWIEPGQPATQGRIYREKAQGRYPDGRVCLVLGAGNISSIGALDLLYKLFVEDQVVLLKMNPVNAYLGPFLERIFGDLIRDGYLQLAYGGIDVGAFLCTHPAVDTLHLTGSHLTHDAIVWGADTAEREARKAAGTPLLDKPITSELGCVTPVIVVPGRWSDAELAYQARHVASMVTHNASFNCNAAKVLVLSRGWPQREAFLGRVQAAMGSIPSRRAYYPGAQERYRQFLDRYPQALPLSPGGNDAVPWTLIPDVPPSANEYALSHEAFCGVLAEVSLDPSDPAAFMERAVEFVNGQVWGNLSCALFIDRPTFRAHRDAYERTLAELRYGAIGVNAWSAVAYALGSTTWGAYPGNPSTAIESGNGVVHNAFFLDHPQKSVVRSHFRVWPKPVWFADHRNLRDVGRNMTWLEARATLPRFVRVVLAGVKG